jgi:hypothetical protein
VLRAEPDDATDHDDGGVVDPDLADALGDVGEVELLSGQERSLHYRVRQGAAVRRTTRNRWSPPHTLASPRSSLAPAGSTRSPASTRGVLS